VLGGGAAAGVAWACLRALRRPRVYLPLTFAQIWEIGIGSLPLVLLVAMISGAVTSEQTGHQYSSTFPPWVVGSVITASVLTELGPLSTGLVLVGRVGARIGAELAAMAVTEQIRGTVDRLQRRLDDARLDSATSELAYTAQSLAGTSAQLRVASTSLVSILAKLDQGHGTLGRALNDSSLYEALLTAATHADEAATGASEMVRDVRARPERHVRVSLF
jgi:hypothetical protein